MAAHADRRRRGDVPHAAAQRRRRARRAHGARLLGLQLSDAVRSPGLLRGEQPRRGGARRPRVHGYPRRPRRRARRGHRRRAVGRGAGGQEPGVRLHAGAAGDQGQGGGRLYRRGSGHPGLHRGARRRDRRGGLALPHHSGAGRAGPRDVGAVPAEPRDLLRSGGVEARRRGGLADGVVRPGARPHLLGHRQPGARLQSRAAAGRQPVHELRGGPGRRYGRDPLALPVHACRSLRLRRGADPGAGGHRTRRPVVQGGAVGEPQRVLLRARPGDGPFSSTACRSSA